MSMPREALALFALLLGTTGPAAGEGPPVARSEPRLCMNVQPPGPEHADAMLSHLRALRVSCIRTSWWHWSTPGSWAWLPRYRAAGVEVLPLVYPAPDGDFRARYRALTDAFGSFPYVQLGNEMDGGLAPGEKARRTGRLWGERIRRVAPLVHASGAKIVSPGLAWNTPGVHDYLAGLLEGAGGVIDVVSVHVYGPALHRTPWGHPFGDRIPHIRAAGWRGPIWTTEIGVSHTEARYMGAKADAWQAESLRRVLADGVRHEYGRIYWFQLTPDPAGWGILRWGSWEPRPAYEWLRRQRG